MDTRTTFVKNGERQGVERGEALTPPNPIGMDRNSLEGLLGAIRQEKADSLAQLSREYDTQARTVERFIGNLNLARECSYFMDETLGKVVDIASRFERKRRVENLYNPHSRLRGGYRATPYPLPRQPTGAGRCYRCGGVGHFVRDCNRPKNVKGRDNDARSPVYAPRQPRPVFVAAAPVVLREALAAPPPVPNPVPSRPIGEIECYRCREMGHYARECTNPRYAGGRGGGRAAYQRGGGQGGGRGRGSALMDDQGPNSMEGTFIPEPR